MATVKFYQAYNMANPTIFYGTVTSATSTQIVINDYAGNIGAYFGYGLTYSGSSVTGGTITAYDSYRNNSIATTVRDVNIDARTLANLVNAGNPARVEEFALSGNDTIEGSNFSDSLLGYGGSDFILGGSGNDFIDGGAGTDTTVYSQARVNYVVTSIAGGYRVVGPDGTDTLTNIENVRFSDGAFSISSLISTGASNTAVDTRDTSSNVVTSSSFPRLQAELLASLKYNSPFGPPTSTESVLLGSGVWGHFGTSNEDVLVGTDITDYIFGYAGRDNISGGKGNDFIYPGDGGFGDGGEGIDTLVFERALSSYTVNPQSVTQAGNVLYLSVVTKSPLPIEVSVFDSIERLQFTDTMLALDTGRFDNAGAAYMLYQAAYDRTPDAAGLGYWIDRLDKGANIVTDVAEYFVNYAPEFTQLYGANPTTSQYVDLLYSNVLNRPANLGGDVGYLYWENQLNSGQMSEAFVLASFANSLENVANVASAIANGIQYQAYVG